MGRRQGTAAAYAKRPASPPSAALPVELASAAPGSARVHLFLGGGEDRGRFAGNRQQRGVIKISNAVCGACYPPTFLT